jgi:hypothetical protein
LRVVVYRGLSFKKQILFLSFRVVLTAFHLLEMRSRSVVQEFYKPKYKKALERIFSVYANCYACHAWQTTSRLSG